MSLHDTKSQTVIENYQPNDTWEQETGAHQSFVSSNYQTPNFQLLKSWLATSKFSLSWLPTSNFFYNWLPTSSFLQNLLPTSNFLQNLLPTSNFFIEIEGGTVPPSISYFCSPVPSTTHQPPARTIKVNGEFEKANFSHEKKWSVFVHLMTIITKRKSIGPHTGVLKHFPSGDKAFSRFKKRPILASVFENPILVSQSHI